MKKPSRQVNRFLWWIFLVFLVIGQVSDLQAARDVWTGVERIVAVGDIHGDYEQFVTLLRSAELLDEKGDWSGGKTHLVQAGDVLDRGPDSRKVMDLLRKLEKQARKSGGYVHALIGNHEAMNIYGDLRYVSPGEYAAFRDKNSEQVRRAFYEQQREELRRRNRDSEEAPVFDDAFRRRWESNNPLGSVEHRFHFGPNGRYGKWIRSHNTVIKINDTLFLHGGISPKYASFSIGKINKTVRRELRDLRKLRGGMVLDPEGPLWYRGLAQEEESLEAHLATVLKEYKVKRIVVAHTPITGAIMPRFDARVLLIDVGISRDYGGSLACLLIEGGRIYALHRGTKLEIPSGATEDLLCYLRQAARLDPSPSPLEATIDGLEKNAATSVLP